jgi:hypothetical protein
MPPWRGLRDRRPGTLVLRVGPLRQWGCLQRVTLFKRRARATLSGPQKRC